MQFHLEDNKTGERKKKTKKKHCSLTMKEGHEPFLETCV